MDGQGTFTKYLPASDPRLKVLSVVSEAWHHDILLHPEGCSSVARAW